MIKLDKIYTRGGDHGQTSLGDGSRVKKHIPRVSTYGDVDEANAAIGLARLHTQGDADAMLERIQNDLFDLGADLCVPEGEGKKSTQSLRVSAHHVERLEKEIDRLNETLPPLTSFILPGGTPASSYLHLARTIVRRAERAATALAEDETINPQAIMYLNRLSDHLFVLVRHLNDNGAQDVLWTPGANR